MLQAINLTYLRTFKYAVMIKKFSIFESLDLVYPKFYWYMYIEFTNNHQFFYKHFLVWQ